MRHWPPILFSTTTRQTGAFCNSNTKQYFSQHNTHQHICVLRIIQHLNIWLAVARVGRSWFRANNGINLVIVYLQSDRLSGWITEYHGNSVYMTWDETAWNNCTGQQSSCIYFSWPGVFFLPPPFFFWQALGDTIHYS